MVNSDARIAERLHQRDSAVLEYVIDLYGSSVYNLVYRILHGNCSTEDMEECVSDVFLEVWNKCQQFDSSRGTLKTWLLILTKYKALDYRRKSKKTPQVEGLANVLPSRDEVEQLYVEKETRLTLLKWLDGFGKIDRQILYKRYFFYETVEQIAISLKLTPKAVENRLYRARKKLRGQVDRDQLWEGIL